MPGLTQRLEVALVRHKLEVLEAADPLGFHGVGVLLHAQAAEELAETAAAKVLRSLSCVHKKHKASVRRT